MFVCTREFAPVYQLIMQTIFTLARATRADSIDAHLSRACVCIAIHVFVAPIKPPPATASKKCQHPHRSGRVQISRGTCVHANYAHMDSCIVHNACILHIYGNYVVYCIELSYHTVAANATNASDCMLSVCCDL